MTIHSRRVDGTVRIESHPGHEHGCGLGATRGGQAAGGGTRQCEPPNDDDDVIVDGEIVGGENDPW